MSFVGVAPEMVAVAASDLERLGSTISTANVAAAGSTTTILAAGADEVSAVIAELFGTHALEYQAISTQLSVFHEQFVQTLTNGVGAYSAAELVNVLPLQNVEQDLLNLVNAPTQALFGRPLIGNGADGAAGTGQAGAVGGILWGNGGSGGSGAAGQAGGVGGTGVALDGGAGGAGGNAGVLFGPGGIGGSGGQGMASGGAGGAGGASG
ncbi:PE family protein, partial [Mycobacterium ulcerans]